MQFGDHTYKMCLTKRRLNILFPIMVNRDRHKANGLTFMPVCGYMRTVILTYLCLRKYMCVNEKLKHM